MDKKQMENTMKKHMYTWFIISVIVGTCAIGLAISPDESTNHPAVFPNTGKPVPLADASRTNNNAALPPMYQGTISNLHDKIGTNAVNHGNDNPDIQAPHTPPQ
jgi:hypothetical protein